MRGRRVLASLALVLARAVCVACTCKKGSGMSPELAISEGADAYEQGRAQESIECFRYARDHKGASPTVVSVALTNIAAVQEQEGDLQGALLSLERSAEVNPSDAEALVIWGKLLCKNGQHEEGLRKYREAIAMEPKAAKFYSSIGTEYQKMSKRGEAIDAYRQAVALDPKMLLARVQLIVALSSGFSADACKECAKHTEAVLKIGGVSGEHAMLIGDVMLSCSRLPLARKALVLACRSYAGTAYTSLVTVPDAPTHTHRQTTPFHRMGALLLQEKYLTNAVTFLQRALEENDPMRGTVLGLLGFCYTQLGALYYDKAVAALSESLAESDLSPDVPTFKWSKASLARQLDSSLANLVRLLHVTADWEHVPFYQRALEDLIVHRVQGGEISPSNPVFALAYSLPDGLVSAIANSYALDNQRKHGERARGLWEGRAAKLTGGRLVVGFLSGDFNVNGVGKHLQDWGLWQECPQFRHVTCKLLSTSNADTSQEPLKTIAGRLGAESMIDLGTGDAKSDTSQLLGAGVHVLLDMAGYTESERPDLVNVHAAALQAQFHGYEGTYGRGAGGWRAFEYIISDRAIASVDYAGKMPNEADTAALREGGGGMFAEKLLLMPPCKFPGADLLSEESLAPSEIAAVRSEFENLVLPELEGRKGEKGEPFIFCNFAKTYKHNEDMMDVWVRVLKRVPNSILWLLGYKRDGAAFAIGNIRRFAELRGVSADRIVFTQLLERGRHIQIKAHAHLLLDTTPYNGHITTAEALWAGVPVLTLARGRLSSRVSHSMLHSLGLDSYLSARTLSEYEDMAVRLARSYRKGTLGGGVYASIREKLLLARGDGEGFFDTESWARSFERGMKMSWEARERGDMHVVVAQ